MSIREPTKADEKRWDQEVELEARDDDARRRAKKREEEEEDEGEVDD